MALESLLEDAFRRGCGISRAHALRTPRYQELLETCPRIPNTTQSETAEMIYLGERLADRAFANLPFAIRQRAAKWSELNYLGRIQTLNLLMAKLTSHEYSRIHRQPYKRLKDVSEVLPAEYGSWTRGKMQSNCLGMAQMLIGFARATGAEYLMVDVITQHDQFSEELFEQMTRKMISLLSPHAADPSIADMIRRLEVHRERSLKALVGFAADQAAHHALLIRVEDDWYVVDPYLGRKYVMTSSRSKSSFATKLIKHPQKRMLGYGGFKREVDSAKSISALELTMEFYAIRGRSVKDFSLEEVVEVASSELAWIGIDPLSGKWPTKSAVEHVFWTTVTASLLTRLHRKTWHDTNHKLSKAFERSFDHRLKLANHRKQERNAAIIRMIRHICVIGMNVIYDSNGVRHTDHRRIEITHPGLHLATMTLNHIGHRTGRPTAELLRFDTSQWIVHDTLREVMNSNNKRLRRIAEASLRQYEKYPHLIMPALLAEVEKRK